MHAVIDSEARVRSSRILHMEAQKAQVDAWIHDQDKMSRYAHDPDLNPLASERKIGKPMGYLELERRLRKLNKNLIFKWGEFNTNYKKICLAVPAHQATPRIILPGMEKLLDDSSKDLGIVYPTKGLMPERSVWRSSIEYRPDPNYKGKASEAIDPKDWEQVPRDDEETAALFAQAGILCETREDSERPPRNHPWAWLYWKWVRVNPNVRGEGWTRHVVPLGEEQRGWRTVLLKLVESEVLTPTQVEKEFLNDNTQEWKSHMGFGAQVLPW